jgi:hypothetical protein
VVDVKFAIPVTKLTAVSRPTKGGLSHFIPFRRCEVLGIWHLAYVRCPLFGKIALPLGIN